MSVIPPEYSSSSLTRTDGHRRSVLQSIANSKSDLLFPDHYHGHKTSKGHRRGTMGKLPRELLDKIIGSIDPNEPGGYFFLLACSCANCSWRRQAQKELFSSVLFDNTTIEEKPGGLYFQSTGRCFVSINLQGKVTHYIACEPKCRNRLWLPRTCRLPTNLLSKVDPIS